MPFLSFLDDDNDEGPAVVSFSTGSSPKCQSVYFGSDANCLRRGLASVMESLLVLLSHALPP